MSEVISTSNNAQILSSLQHDKLVLQRQLSEVKMENEILRFQLYQMSTILDLAVSKLSKLGVFLETPIDIRTLRANVQKWANQNFNVDENNEDVAPVRSELPAVSVVKHVSEDTPFPNKSTVENDIVIKNNVACEMQINNAKIHEDEKRDLEIIEDEVKEKKEAQDKYGDTVAIVSNSKLKNAVNNLSAEIALASTETSKKATKKSQNDSGDGDDNSKNVGLIEKQSSNIDNIVASTEGKTNLNSINHSTNNIESNCDKSINEDGKNDYKHIYDESSNTKTSASVNTTHSSSHSRNNIVLPFTPVTSSYNKRFQLRMHLREHTKAVHCCAFIPGDDPFIVTGGLDRRLVLQNFFTGAKQWEVVAHDESIVDVAWFDATKHILSASYDGTVKLWDARRGEMKPLYEHVAYGFVLAAIPLDKSHLFACADARNRTSIVDTRTSRPITWEHESRVNSLAFDSSARQLIMGHSDGVLSIWDMRRLSMTLSSSLSSAVPSSSLSSSSSSPAAVMMEHKAPMTIHESNKGVINENYTNANANRESSNVSAMNAESPKPHTSSHLVSSDGVINTSAMYTSAHSSMEATSSPAILTSSTNTTNANNYSSTANNITNSKMFYSQSVVNEYEDVSHKVPVTSVHIPCLARIRSNVTHSSISFVGQYCGVDDMKRMVVISNDNLVRLYRATLNARTNNVMHGAIPPVATATSTSSVLSLTSPSSSSSSFASPPSNVAAMESRNPALPDKYNNNSNIINSSSSSNNSSKNNTHNAATFFNDAKSLNDGVMSSSIDSIGGSGAGGDNNNKSINNNNSNNNNNSSNKSAFTSTPYSTTQLRSSHLSMNSNSANNISNTIPVITEPLSDRGEGELYYLRNILSGVPTYGHKVRGAFWRGKREKAQLSMFFDDGDKDAEVPLTRSITECDLVVSGGYEHTATVFDCTDEGTCVVLDRLAGHRDYVTGATIHHSNSRLIIATTSADATVRIWVPVKM